ncbi:hypothetical protein [Nocardia sp. NBC_01327]|uniref:hypothetical protein n=1 Tax=Nocardia sp. NBC_01327 TaxID=2903593 RepID=UPI002E125AFB|nr:hypothetical protein OG326_28105 [Nocardia sp. NBC_01327]
MAVLVASGGVPDLPSAVRRYLRYQPEDRLWSGFRDKYEKTKTRKIKDAWRQGIETTSLKDFGWQMLVVFEDRR